MAKDRADGEGTVFQRPNGRWTAKLRYIDPATGEYKRASATADTKKLALKELGEVRKRIESGAPARDAKTPLGEWAALWRQSSLPASNRAASTREMYANLCRKWIEGDPTLSVIRLDRLKAVDVERFLVDLRARTKPGPKVNDKPGKPVRALGDSSIRSIYVVLRAVLDIAVRDGLIAKNPAAAVARPGVARREAEYLTADQTDALLAQCTESRHYGSLVLIASTGLRRGEALGLMWRDVNWQRATLTVRNTLGRVAGSLTLSKPKTERSRRTLPLSPELVAMLREIQADQKVSAEKLGTEWDNRDGLVFVTDFGRPIDPRNLTRTVTEAAAKAGITGVTGPHMLRHGAATQLLESGVHVKAVADILGHSSIAITGDIYGHSSQDHLRDALQMINR
ncbi:tyrosine-type recombinase/integrase [Mycobacterium sp. PDNC021]|uniref:tyrosine-type recombinase/integrase n=1 Tax=Mycobacterium sp. PDNC021 TaxID=3391399 RepID=UPI003AACA7DE